MMNSIYNVHKIQFLFHRKKSFSPSINIQLKVFEEQTVVYYDNLTKLNYIM